jgi:hypothetical protein
VIQTALALVQFAPTILHFFGVGEKPVAVAEQVVNIAQTVTGAKSPQEALDALRANAELAQQFNLAVLAANTELEKAALADRADARARDIEIRKLKGGDNRRQDVMIAMAAIGLIACLVTLIFFRKEIPGEAVGIISTIAGIFGACLKDAFAFEFGSSRGSKEKDAILGRMAGSDK